jgi:hypothetical protein
VYFALPETFSHPSTRGILCPTIMPPPLRLIFLWFPGNYKVAVPKTEVFRGKNPLKKYPQ